MIPLCHDFLDRKQAAYLNLMLEEPVRDLRRKRWQQAPYVKEVVLYTDIPRTLAAATNLGPLCAIQQFSLNRVRVSLWNENNFPPMSVEGFTKHFKLPLSTTRFQAQIVILLKAYRGVFKECLGSPPSYSMILSADATTLLSILHL